MSRPVDPRLVRAVPLVRRLLTTLGALQVAGAVLTVAQATLLAQVVAALVLREPGGLAPTLVGLAATGAGRAAVAAAQEWITARASVGVRADLRRAVLRAVVTLGPVWSARQPSGRLVTASGPGLDALDGYLTRALPALVSAGVVPAVVLARIGWADWQSAAVLVVCLPLVPVFMVLVGVTTRRRMQTQYAMLARLSGHFLDLLQGLTTLKIYGQAGRQVATVRRATDEYRRHTMATLKIAFLSGAVLDLIATMSVAVVAVDVGLRLDHGTLSLHTSLLILLLAPELFAPLRAVGAQYHANEEGRVAASAALDILDEAADAALPAIAVDADAAPSGEPPAPGVLRIERLRVGYAGRGDDALRGVDLQIDAGQLVAVSGTSGAGKSTLLAVLLGLLPAGEGRVRFGARALPRGAEDGIRQWRSALAWVPQRPTPSQPTAGAEVRLGDPGATDAQVQAAIDACHAPDADTPLGQDGAHISAGQRRRLALARALLRARAVQARGEIALVLLDEPSEDLDADTELVVASVIASLAGWATVMMITHSSELAAIADRRIELTDGRVAADHLQVPAHTPAIRSADRIPDTPGHRTSLRVAPPAGAVSLRPLLGDARATWRRLARAAMLSGAGGLAGLALTATSIWLICRAAQHPNVQALAVAVVGVRTFALARALLRYFERIAAHDAALLLLAEVRARVFAALEPLAPAGLAQFRRGDLLRRFVGDVDAAQEGLVRAVLPCAGAALTVTGAVVVSAVIAPAAGWVLAAGLLCGLVLVPWLAGAAAGPGAALAAATGNRDQHSAALLSGLAELTGYDATGAALDKVIAADSTVARAGRRPAAAAAGSVALAGLLAGGTLPALLAVASHEISAGLDPVATGTLVACALVGFDALAPLPAAFAAWSRFRASLARVAQLLATPAPMPDPLVPVEAPVGLFGLHASDLTLAPAVDAPAVLRGAHLQLRPGDRVAVMGPSGCGKTTLLTAALRLLPPRTGTLDVVGTVAATPLSSLAAASMPPVAAGSLQGDHVFDTTLRDNLRVVRPAATDRDLDRVAARAGLTGFVAALPQGWDTAAGADGTALSGGQRQRLLLARALLADPAILVLDEPTAHLDEDTERAVLRDLLDGTAGRTVLMSTHRRLPADELDLVIDVADHACVSRGPSTLLSGGVTSHAVRDELLAQRR